VLDGNRVRANVPWLAAPHAGRTVAELAEHVGGTVVGDPDCVITGVASLTDARESDIAYVESRRRFAAAALTNAGCVVVPFGAAIGVTCRIECSAPKLAFVKIAALLMPPVPFPAGVHPTASIDARAILDPAASIGAYVSIGAFSRIGPNTRVAAGVSVGAHVTIGAGCELHPRVVLYDHVQIGSRVILHAGVVIGADGFGYIRDLDQHWKFPHAGTVRIEDDVEIGAGSCVDRAAFGSTRIGRGSKLDNLVHVGHNADIGERVIIAAQSGISGSVIIEDDVVLAGQVGIGEHAHVRRGAMIAAKSAVLPGKIVRAGTWFGIPVRPITEAKRLHAHSRRLPQIRKDVADLRRRIRGVGRKRTPE
jgi:UDP-3-O-[3-hydroxymyristoyl] glucosamine N-acyltransferase